MADTTIGPARVVRSNAASPVPLALVPAKLLPSNLILPVIGHLDVSGGSFPVWIYRASDYSHRSSPSLGSAIGLSSGAWSALRRVCPAGEAAEPEASLVIDRPHRVTVSGALASDLPRGNDVHVSQELARALGSRRLRRSPECLLSTSRLCAPVRVVGRRSHGNTILRAGMLTRALFEFQVGDDVQLSLIPRAPRQVVRSLRSRTTAAPSAGSPFGALTIVWGAVILFCRLFDWLVEALLRALLRAPGQPVRVVQGHPGDDSPDRRVVRLHPSVFPVLGITPGMQVFLQWGKGRTTAIALDDYQPHSPTIPTFLRERQAAGTRLDLPPEFPPHLVARVSLAVRRDLGMSSDTVAVIRRRLRTAVLSHLNQLIIPVAGLILAALAIKGFQGWKLYTGLGLVIIFGLVPLRKSPPPSGRWP